MCEGDNVRYIPNEKSDRVRSRLCQQISMETPTQILTKTSCLFSTIFALRPLTLRWGLQWSICTCWKLNWKNKVIQTTVHVRVAVADGVCESFAPTHIVFSKQTPTRFIHSLDSVVALTRPCGQDTRHDNDTRGLNSFFHTVEAINPWCLLQQKRTVHWQRQEQEWQNSLLEFCKRVHTIPHRLYNIQHLHIVLQHSTFERCSLYLES